MPRAISGGVGGEEKKLFPVSSSFAAGNLGAQEDFRCSTFPALFELSWGGELERKKVVVGGCVCAPSVSRGRAQVPGDVAVAPLLSQVHGQAAPGIAHIQPSPGSVQGHQRVQEALPGSVVHWSGEGGGVRAVGVCAVEQQQLGHAGAAHHHHLDRASPKAVESVGIHTGFEELPHGLHLAPRRGVGQVRITATTTEHALVLFAHFAAPKRKLSRIIHR